MDNKELLDVYETIRSQEEKIYKLQASLQALWKALMQSTQGSIREGYQEQLEAPMSGQISREYDETMRAIDAKIRLLKENPNL